MIRVLICDDQRVVCEGLRAILGTAASITVVGAARDGAEAVELVAHARPEVVLMDLKLARRPRCSRSARVLSSRA